MPVPLPVDLSVGAAPYGWQGELPELFDLIQASLQAQLDPTFLIGRVGANMPQHDIGPWFDGQAWWFWDSLSGQYQPDEQGLPIGSIAMWGGSGGSIPSHWLSCYGQDVSRFTYSRLFGAIGETWGPGDGQTTFGLPPGGVFFINAAGGFVADSTVPLNPLPALPNQQPVASSPEGVGARGGAQTMQLLDSDMPGLQVILKTMTQNFANAITAGNGSPASNIQPPQASHFDGQIDMPICDMSNNPLGSNQKNFLVMPPYTAINFMIKYQ